MPAIYRNLEEVVSGGKPAVARVLSALETEKARHIDLLDEAYQTPRGKVIGLTGPPGVGKSSLIQAMIAGLRGRGDRVAVIAVDPSSQLTGGALLGDRTRLKLDPEDSDLFVRSMAARTRLGGLSDETFAAAILLRALFDWVIVESVGVGQSEADIRLVADCAVLCIQPGSGDSLQFMKAGIMEVPDLIVVTKADLGAPVDRAVADVEGALSLSTTGKEVVEVLAVSALTGQGTQRFCDILSQIDALSPHQRDQRTADWLKSTLIDQFGRVGLERLENSRSDQGSRTPFSDEARLSAKLLSVFSAS